MKPPRLCSEPGCQDRAICRGWCRTHYKRRWDRGEVQPAHIEWWGDDPPPRVRAEILARLAKEREAKAVAMAAGDGGAPGWEPRVYRVRTARRR